MAGAGQEITAVTSWTAGCTCNTTGGVWSCAVHRSAGHFERMDDPYRHRPSMPDQAQTLAWVAERWPDRTALIWRAAKLGEEAGEVLGAVIKMDEGRKTLADLRMEVAQVVICAMALAESAGFDLFTAIADEYERATRSAGQGDG